MAKLRELESFKGDYHNESYYNSESIEELEDNVLFLLEEVEDGENYFPKESLENLKDMMKNYYGDVVSDFLSN